MQLLNPKQIQDKIRRLAMEIMERNTEESELYMIGINNRGMELARRLKAEIEKLASGKLLLWNVRLSPADPMSEPVVFDHDVKLLAGKAVLLIDDVANTGRTLFYALLPLMEVLPKKIEVAVLVDREHKLFPVQTTYIGLQLSTTIQDNILVEFGGEDKAILE